MEKQLFHRCNHSYLSCLGLCQAVAANQPHSEGVNFARGIVGCRRLCVQGPDHGRYLSLLEFAVDGSTVVKFQFSGSGRTE